MTVIQVFAPHLDLRRSDLERARRSDRDLDRRRSDRERRRRSPFFRVRSGEESELELRPRAGIVSLSLCNILAFYTNLTEI